VTLNNRKMVF